MADKRTEEKTVLVVDDDILMQQVVAMRLKVNGFRVLVASDGEEALPVIRSQSPSLIVLDLMLPKITGYELCRMIKMDEELQSIPVLVLSALEKQTDRDRAMEAGADAYFIKPFDLELLVAKIKQLL